MMIARAKQILEERCHLHNDLLGRYSHKLMFGMFGEANSIGKLFGVDKIYQKWVQGLDSLTSLADAREGLEGGSLAQNHRGDPHSDQLIII